MKVEIFSNSFSEEVKSLSSQNSRGELYQDLMESLDGQKPLQVMQHTLAYLQEKFHFLKNFLQEPDRALPLTEKEKKRLLDSPQHLKISLLSLLFSPSFPREWEKGEDLFLDTHQVSFFLNMVYYFTKENSPLGLKLFEKVEEDLFSLSQRFQWLKNLLTYLLFYRSSSFPLSLDESLFIYPSLESADRDSSFSEEVKDLFLKILFDLIQRIYEKNGLLSMVEQMGELVWLSERLGLKEQHLPSFKKWFQKIGFGDRLQNWLLALSGEGDPRKALSECASVSHEGHSFSMMLPLLKFFHSEGSLRETLWGEVEKILPLEDRMKAMVLLAEGDPVVAQRGWDLLGKMEDPFRKLKGLIALCHIPEKRDFLLFQRIFPILKDVRPGERKFFWRIFSLIPSGTPFLEHFQDRVCQDLKLLRDPIDRLILCLSLGESLGRDGENLFLGEAQELITRLHGENKICSDLLFAIWEYRQNREVSLDPIFSSIEQVSVVSQRLVLMESLLPYCTNSAFFLPFAHRLIQAYLKDYLYFSSRGLPRVTSCLSFKAVIARGWNYSQNFFEKAFALSEEEGDESVWECKMAVVWDLAEIAESTGIPEPWTKALALVCKMKNPYVQRLCLLRLLHLPSYAISIDGSKITKVMREVGRIRDDLERHRAFCEGWQWIYQRSHLITDKTSLLNVLKRVARSFRSPSQVSEARGKLALVCLGWRRHREAAEFFSKAMEGALGALNEYQRFQALDVLAPSLSLAGHLEDKGEFIHDIMEASETMMDYQAEVYGLISNILENWGREERAQNALAKAIQLCENNPDELKRLLALRYLCGQIQGSPSLNQKKLLDRFGPLAEKFSKGLLVSEAFAYIGGAYLSCGDRTKGIEAFKKALAEVAQITPAQNQIKVLHIVLDKLLDGGAFESEREVFDLVVEVTQNITYPLFRDKIYCKILETAFKSSLSDYGEEILDRIQNSQEKNKALLLCTLHHQYRNPSRALNYALQIRISRIQQEAVRKLAKNLAFFKDPSKAGKLFELALPHKRSIDTVLAFYIKSLGSPSQIVSVLESF